MIVSMAYIAIIIGFMHKQGKRVRMLPVTGPGFSLVHAPCIAFLVSIKMGIMFTANIHTYD